MTVARADPPFGTRPVQEARMGSLRRRDFLVAAGALLATPRIAAAQPSGNSPRIGYLAFNTPAIGRDVLVAFRQAMRQLGWIEGRNIVVETRFADGNVDRLPALVDELLQLKVDVIVAASSAATRASRAATATVPIVMLASADAVGEGLVASLAHPGGNVTGMTLLAGPEIASKQLELLREIAPAASRVAVLMNPRNHSHAAFLAELTTAAWKTGADVQAVRAETLKGIEEAFVAVAKARAGALLVLSDAMFLGERRRIVELARSGGLPAMYSQREFTDAGGLVSYGPSLVDMSRRGARHVDAVLRGAKPQDVPVEQPTTFELVVNTRTAKSLGVTVPRSLQLRADVVIE